MKLTFSAVATSEARNTNTVSRKTAVAINRSWSEFIITTNQFEYIYTSIKF